MSCIEELPRIEADVHQPLKDTDYAPIGIHVGGDVNFAISTAADTGMTFPMVIDYDGAVLAKYNRIGENIILFPLAYLLGRDLTVERIYLQVEPTAAALRADIEAALAP